MVKYDLTQFEEKRFADLLDKFVDKNQNQWNTFVEEEYQLYLEGFNSIDDCFDEVINDERQNNSES